MAATLRILQTGPLALLQDLGRPGLAGLGVSPSGAADRRALALANRLVGNPETACGIEVTFGGLVATTDRPLWCVLTGPVVEVRIEQPETSQAGPGRVVGSHQPFVLQPDQRLTVGVPDSGLRNYLAVRGGLDVASTLGSRSTDLLSRLGPAPLRIGDHVITGTPRHPMIAADVAAPPEPVTALTISPGPRSDWFSDAGWQTLLGTTWRVSAESNRIGIRLEGPALERAEPSSRELPSEGMITGAIQVPPAGRPVIFGPDHPVTGGYPVIAVLTADSCDDAAQLPGGAEITFSLAPSGGR